MHAFEFSREAICLFSKYGFIKSIEIQLLDEPVAKIRADIDADTFIVVFYNAETSRYSYVLIKDNKRIFGIDNARGWHIHPFENPESHLETNPVSLAEFLETLAFNTKAWQR